MDGNNKEINLNRNYSENIVYDNYFMEVKTLQGEVIASGPIISQKSKIMQLRENLGCWVSVENKFFFNIGSSNLQIYIDKNTIPYQQVREDLLKGLNVQDWMNYQRVNFENLTREIYQKVDVFRDKDLSEADIEIREFLYWLNTIPGIRTTGSCSGHNTGGMYISFKVDFGNGLKDSIATLQRFTGIISKLNLDEIFYIQTDPSHIIWDDWKLDQLNFQFRSRGIGNERVWRALDEFKIAYEDLF